MSQTTAERGPVGTARPGARSAAVPRYGWQDRAACRDVPLGLFFGPDGEPAAQRRSREEAALRVCATCPVRQACLAHALVVPEVYGVWGGTTESDRAAARERERRGAPDAA
ncbi:MAG: WhiB family transcriptional regulator [Pseudonocardia sp.]